MTPYTTIVRGHQRHVRRPPSAQQLKRRNAFTVCKTYWSTSIPPLGRKQWAIKAPRPRTGFTHFMHYNLVRAYNDLPLYAWPPE